MRCWRLQHVRYTHKSPQSFLFPSCYSSVRTSCRSFLLWLSMISSSFPLNPLFSHSSGKLHPQSPSTYATLNRKGQQYFVFSSQWTGDSSRRIGPSALGLTMGRVDSEIDGHRGNPFVGASNTICFSLNLQTDLLKIGEFLPFAVQELAIFYLNRDRVRNSHQNQRNPQKVWWKHHILKYNTTKHNWRDEVWQGPFPTEFAGWNRSYSSHVYVVNIWDNSVEPNIFTPLIHYIFSRVIWLLGLTHSQESQLHRQRKIMMCVHGALTN